MKHDIIEGQNVTIKDGVAYFDEPYFTSLVLFSSKYNMRDFIIQTTAVDDINNDGGSKAYIIAMPVTPDDTKTLHRQFKENNMYDKGYILFIGDYEGEGVMYID